MEKGEVSRSGGLTALFRVCGAGHPNFSCVCFSACGACVCVCGWVGRWLREREKEREREREREE
jgi:hypothetical protein